MAFFSGRSRCLNLQPLPNLDIQFGVSLQPSWLSVFCDLEGSLDARKGKGGDPITLRTVSLQPLPEPLRDRHVLGKVNFRPAPQVLARLGTSGVPKHAFHPHAMFAYQTPKSTWNYKDLQG